MVCCLLAHVCSVTPPDLIQPVIPWNRLRILNWRCYPIHCIHQIWHPVIVTLFSPQRNPVHGRHFRLVEEVKEVVLDWLVQEPKHFFSRGICALVESSRWCAEHGGLCWRLISSYSVCFCYKLLYIIFKLTLKLYISFWTCVQYFRFSFEWPFYNISA